MTVCLFGILPRSWFSKFLEQKVKGTCDLGIKGHCFSDASHRPEYMLSVLGIHTRLTCSELKMTQTKLSFVSCGFSLFQALNGQGLSTFGLFPVTVPPIPFLGLLSLSDVSFYMTILVLLF